MEETIVGEEDSFPDEYIFLISTYDPWYGDILVYLQTLKCPAFFSQENRCNLQVNEKIYLIIDDTLYWHGVDSILRRYLTHEEAELVLNGSHSRACGGHLFGLATAQKILRAGYFWPTIFKDCVEAMKRCHPCHLYTRKMQPHTTPLFPVIAVGLFTKWGVDYVTYNLVLVGGHKYIIVIVDYFTKWAEAIPTFRADKETTIFFIFN